MEETNTGRDLEPVTLTSVCGAAHFCDCAVCGYVESVDGMHHLNFARSHKFVPSCLAARLTPGGEAEKGRITE